MSCDHCTFHRDYRKPDLASRFWIRWAKAAKWPERREAVAVGDELFDIDPVERALSLLVQSARVSPPLRDAVQVVEDEIRRLRRRAKGQGETRG